VYGKYFSLLAYIELIISSFVGRCARGIFYYLGFVSLESSLSTSETEGIMIVL
jgi:hypothetical protein